MSAFLGPIHTWLYGKILFQNELIDRIIELAKSDDVIDADFNTDIYGVLEQGELADIVDGSNIHGWLQERVSLVENKLAYLVTALTEADPNYIVKISDTALKLGSEHQAGADANAKEIFAQLETLLLNGMPCDRVNEVVSEEADCVIWQQVQDIHKRYWDEVNGNLEFFYVIREAIITGILEGTAYTFKDHGNHNYEISK